MIALIGCEFGHVDLFDNWADGPSSSGRIGIRFSFAYEGPKTIKYCTFTFVPVNAVDDVVACTRTGKVELEIQITGPLKSGRYFARSEGWYNRTIRDVLSPRVDIQYMDGSTETISGDQVYENSLAYEQLLEQRRRKKKCALSRFAEDHPGYFLLCTFILIILMCALLIHLPDYIDHIRYKSLYP